MRAKGRTDANQSRIVEALRKIGCSVSITSGVGNGFPDLLVGYMGTTTLLEVKDGEKPPSDRKLTAAEAHFLATWKGGPAVVVEDEQEAINAVIAHAECRAEVARLEGLILDWYTKPDDQITQPSRTLLVEARRIRAQREEGR